MSRHSRSSRSLAPIGFALVLALAALASHAASGCVGEADADLGDPPERGPASRGAADGWGAPDDGAAPLRIAYGINGSAWLLGTASSLRLGFPPAEAAWVSLPIAADVDDDGFDE